MNVAMQETKVEGAVTESSMAVVEFVSVVVNSGGEVVKEDQAAIRVQRGERSAVGPQNATVERARDSESNDVITCKR
jgi:hypothetical protein